MNKNRDTCSRFLRFCVAKSISCARSRAAAEISESRLAYSYNLQGKVVICKKKHPCPTKRHAKACAPRPFRDAAHTRCALFPPNLAFGKEGGQAYRSRPHKIPRKSQGVYLTFTPLPAPRRRGLVRRADERGLSPPVSPEPGAYLRGTASPLDLAQLRKVPVYARL